MNRALAIAVVFLVLVSPAEAGRWRFMKRQQTRQIEAQTGVSRERWRCKANRAEARANLIEIGANVSGGIFGGFGGLLLKLFR